MTKDTDEHAYTMPTPGSTTDWGTTLNSLIDDDLENDIILRDTKSNRPSASNTSVAWFYATDETLLYYNEGSSWTQATAPGHGDLSNVSTGDHRTDEQIEDLVATVLAAKGNISITHDDANDQIDIDTSALNTEEVEDAVSNLVAAGTNLSWAYDDPNSTLTVSFSGPITGVQVGESGNAVSGVYTDLADIADTSTDPSSNGEIRRNSADVKVHSGGSVQNLSNVGSGGGGLTTTVIDSGTTTSHTTSDEDIIYADTSSAAVTITLASSDATQGNEIEVVNIDGSNAVTIQTEGSETIDPNAASSKSIGKAGWNVAFVSDGTNWDSSLAAEFDSISTGKADITNETFVKSILNSDVTGQSSGAETVIADTENDDNLGEQDASFNFNPSDTGRYRINAAAYIYNSTDQDFIDLIVKDADADSIVESQTAALSGTQDKISYVFVVKLTSGTNYQVVCTNVDSSYNVSSGGGEGNTGYVITREVIHP